MRAAEMIPRNMRVDFSGVPMLWSSNRIYATVTNAGSPGATGFEPYLHKVMAWARDELGGKDPEVERDINLFIAQEGHHYRVHAAFNKQLYLRYPRARDFEIELAEGLRRQFETKSLEYNLAYCCGFENFACMMAKFMFARALPWFDQVDNRMAVLWQWHLAEEFEHRAACHDAFRAMSGNYFARIRGLIVFIRHVLPWQRRLVNYMLEVDRAEMSEAERAEHVKERKRYDRLLSWYVFPRALALLMPFYDPRKQKAPPELHEALGRFQDIAAKREPLAA
jgi:predicted metal-dependent hydrolase